MKITKENWKYLTLQYLQYAKNDLAPNQNKTSDEISALIEYIKLKLK